MSRIWARSSPVDGLDQIDDACRSRAPSLEISWPGGHLDLASDDEHINVDVAVAQEIRDAFAGTSLSEIAVYDSLDTPDSSLLQECAVQVLMTVPGRRWESSDGIERSDTPTSFDLLIRVLAPAERSALLAARTILRKAVEAVVS